MVRRAVILASALVLTFAFSGTVEAQGREDRGPAFCRNGKGHPNFGWRWCEERGWDRSRGRVVQRGRDGRIIDRGRITDRRRDDRGQRDRWGWRTGVALDKGYTDGYEKGLEDSDKNRSFDPTRHGWYRSADRGYDSDYGTKSEYKNDYREGFRSGYDAGFRDRERYERRDQRGSDGSRRPGTAVPRRWP